MSMLVAALAVSIRVYDAYGLPPDQREAALAVAAETLARAGVQAAMMDCSRGTQVMACALPPADGELILRLRRHPANGTHVLGDAIVHDDPAASTVATVYTAAVAERSRRLGLALPLLVGRVAAHEIGHLLIGSRAHSREGLMRAAWDVGRPVRADWEFSADDAARMRARLRRHEDVIARAAPR